MNLGRVFRAIASLQEWDDPVDDVQALRDMLDSFAAMLNTRLPRTVQIHEQVAYRNAEGHDLYLDVLQPPGPGPHPVVVYIHGGAWIWGSPATHRKLTCRLAQQGFLTFSVDYRLAPEHPFPAAFNDCVHAVYFAAANAHRWHGDPQRLGLAGDSAGGNLAAAVAIELSTRTAAPLARAVGLLYGVFDFSGFDPTGITQLLQEAYLGPDGAELLKDPRVSPLVKAARLPPAHIAVGDADPLLEDAQALHAAMLEDGKTSELQIYPDMPHAFMQMEFLPEARTALANLSRFLHQHLD